MFPSGSTISLVEIIKTHMIDPTYKRDNLLTVQVDDRPDGAKTLRFRMQIGVDANKMVTLYLTDLSEVLAQ